MTASGTGRSRLTRAALWAAAAFLLAAGSPAQARKHHKGGAAAPDTDAAPAGGAKANKPSQAAPAIAGLLEQGRAALGAKDLGAARTALTEAYRQSPSAEVLFELGALAAAEGRKVAAHDLMRRYLQDTAGEAESPGQKEAQRLVEQDSEASGEVRVLGARGAFMLVDDKLVGALPLGLPLLLPLGTHKVTVELGSQRVEEQLKILSGQLAEMRINQRTGVVVVSLPPAVVLLPEGPGTQALQKLLPPALRPAAAKERHAVVTREQALAQVPSLSGCLDKLSCQVDLVNQNEALYALRLRASGGPERGPWKLELQLLDGGAAAVAATATPSCADCTAEQAAAAVAAALGPMLQEATSRPRGSVTISSEPSAAEVYIAGEKVGVTPYRAGRFVGTHEVELQKEGYKRYKSSLVVSAGQTATLSATLAELGEAEPPPAALIAQPQVGALTPSRRPRWRIISGISLISGGALLAGFGASALSVDGQCDLEAAPNSCPARYDTLVPGAVLLGVGALLVVGGITLAAVPGSRKRTSVAIAPVLLRQGGAPIGAGLRF